MYAAKQVLSPTGVWLRGETKCVAREGTRCLRRPAGCAAGPFRDPNQQFPPVDAYRTLCGAFIPTVGSLRGPRNYDGGTAFFVRADSSTAGRDEHF